MERRESNNLNRPSGYSARYYQQGPSAPNRSSTPAGRYGHNYGGRHQKYYVEDRRRNVTPNVRHRPQPYGRSHTPQIGTKNQRGVQEKVNKLKTFERNVDTTQQPRSARAYPQTHHRPHHYDHPKIDETYEVQQRKRGPDPIQAQGSRDNRVPETYVVHQQPSDLRQRYDTNVDKSNLRMKTSPTKFPPKSATNPHQQWAEKEDLITSASESMYQRHNLVDPNLDLASIKTMQGSIASQSTNQSARSNISPDLDQRVTVTATFAYDQIKITNPSQSLHLLINIKDSKSMKGMIEVDSNIDVVCAVSICKQENVESVKETLRKLLELLRSGDRLAIVYHNNYPQLHMNFKSLKNANLTKIEDSIDTVDCWMAKDCVWSLKSAQKLLEARKFKNQNSCILLLSDQQKQNSIKTQLIDFIMTNKTKKKAICEYALAVFGFGDDHDAYLLQRLAEKKFGKYFYVGREGPPTAGMLFESLAMATSILGQNIRGRFLLKPNSVMKSPKFKRVYGSHWKLKSGIDAVLSSFGSFYSGFDMNFMFLIDSGPFQHTKQEVGTLLESLVGELYLWIDDSLGLSPRTIRFNTPITIKILPSTSSQALLMNPLVDEEWAYVRGMKTIERSEIYLDVDDVERAIQVLDEFSRSHQMKSFEGKPQFILLRRAIEAQRETVLNQKRTIERYRRGRERNMKRHG